MSFVPLVVGSYLLGSVSFSVLIVRAVAGFDVRTVGSGNAGASNVLRSAGRGPAAAVLLLDIVKGVAPVLLARRFDAPGPMVGAVAMAVVLGHVFPAYHGFRGGKGVATAAGALGSLSPGAAGLAALVFAAVLAASRFIALASITAVVAFPVLAYLCGRAGWVPPPPAWLLVSSAAIALLIVVKHRDNVKRLRAGTEPRIGERRREPA